MHADVVGYSRLSGADEDGTHHAVTAAFELITAYVNDAGGKVVNYAGDAVLVDFPTVSDALNCAVRVQDELDYRNTGLHESQRVLFRIGINLGEVIVDRNEIFGDGVNVAARLQSLAKAGGICISGSTYDAIGRKLSLSYRNLGEHQFKNIDQPVRVYEITRGEDSKAAKAETKRRTHAFRSFAWPVVGASIFILAAISFWYLTRLSPFPPLTPSTTQLSDAASVRTDTGRPEEVPETSIAVLPFTNLNNDPTQDYFIDGVTNDIITDLSQLSGLFVIASNSVFTYKGAAIKVQQVGRELGVKYVLEGSIQRAGNRVRINAQLINAESGHHLWADRFDQQLTDIFALQDEVSRRIVSALAIKLTPLEQARLNQSGEVNPQAYDTLLRGLELFRRFTPETNAEARRYFQRAVAIEPDFARAHADITLTHAMDLQFGWQPKTKALIDEALVHGEKALALNPNVRQVHFALCSLYTVLKQHDKAIAAGREAVRIDPNYADGYANLAQALIFAGQPEEALTIMENATRLNPRYAFFYTWIIGRAHMLLGHYDEAVALFKEVIENNAHFTGAHLTLAAIYGNVGPLEDAEWQAAEILALLPDFSLAREREQTPYRDPIHLDWYIDGLRKAGLPE